MARMLWITTLSIALASTAGVVKASAANPLESLAVTARASDRKRSTIVPPSPSWNR